MRHTRGYREPRSLRTTTRATQLAYPIDDESYLVGLMYPGQDTARAYISSGVETPAYDEGGPGSQAVATSS